MDLLHYHHITSEWQVHLHFSCYLWHLCYLTYGEYITWNARLDEAQAGIKTARRNINNLRYADDTTLMAEMVFLAVILELDHKEGCVPRNWYFWIVVLEKALESPLDCNDIKSKVNPKENQSWIFIGRTDAEAEAPILWPPDTKSWFTKDWCWERLKAKGARGGRGWDG